MEEIRRLFFFVDSLTCDPGPRWRPWASGVSWLRFNTTAGASCHRRGPLAIFFLQPTRCFFLDCAVSPPPHRRAFTLDLWQLLSSEWEGLVFCFGLGSRVVGRQGSSLALACCYSSAKEMNLGKIQSPKPDSSRNMEFGRYLYHEQTRKKNKTKKKHISRSHWAILKGPVDFSCL